MAAAGAALRRVEGQGVERLFEFCVLGMVACGYLAVAGSGYLDAPTVLLTAGALLMRSLIAGGIFPLRPSPILVNIATLAYIAFYPIDYLFLSKEFLPATVHLVFFLAVTKVLTASTDRDFAYLKVVAFLELMAACLLNGRLNFFVFLTLFLLFAIGTFSTSEIRRSAGKEVRVVRAGYRRLQPRLVGLGLIISLGVLTMTGGLFFFLPRTARAAFRHLIPERYHLPGFSNEVTLGQLGEIKTQSTAVMHVRFLSATWPVNLKWRGAALSQFDGRRWYNDLSVAYEPIRNDANGLVRLLDESHRPSSTTRRIHYEVHQKDFGSDTLFFAGIPEFLSISAPVIRRSSSNSIRAPFSPNGLHYIAHGYLEPDGNPDVLPEPLSPTMWREYLELPSLDPRIPRLAREVANVKLTQEAQAKAIEEYLRTQYGYTLTLLSREVPDPLADFLFERKKGHCEYFASAMAVMLRTVGIPSRVVTGFQSGVYNPLSGLQVIRSSDAHSWVEAYLPRRGWTTFDPTPADPNAVTESVWTRLSLFMDAAETFWQDWVINYDLDHQLLLATRMQDSGRSSSSWGDAATSHFRVWRHHGSEFLKRYGAPLAAGFLILAVIIVQGPALLNAWKTRQRLRRVQKGQVDASDATLLYTRMLRSLERRGFEKPAWVTAAEFAATIPASNLTPLVDDLTEAYQKLRYGGQRDAAPRMLALLDQLEKM